MLAYSRSLSLAAAQAHPNLAEVHLFNFGLQEEPSDLVRGVLQGLPSLTSLSIDYARGNSVSRSTQRQALKSRGSLLLWCERLRLRHLELRLACRAHEVLPALAAADMARTLRRLALGRCVIGGPLERFEGPEVGSVEGGACDDLRDDLARVLLCLPLFDGLEELELGFVLPTEDWAGVGVGSHDVGGAAASRRLPWELRRERVRRAMTNEKLRRLVAPLAWYRSRALRRVALGLPREVLHGDVEGDREGGAVAWECCLELMKENPGLSIDFVP